MASVGPVLDGAARNTVEFAAVIGDDGGADPLGVNRAAATAKVSFRHGPTACGEAGRLARR